MTISKTVKLSSKGQLILPREIRVALNLQEGDVLVVSLSGDELKISRPAELAASTRGLVKGTYGKTKKQIDAYLQEERRAWE